MTFDPLAEERVAGGDVLARAGNGNPLIVPRDCAEPEEYTRASSLADFLARDIFGLKKWEMRYLARGLGLRPDLAAWAATLHYSTGPLTGTLPLEERKRTGQQLDEIIAMALETVGIHEAANSGSAVHEATIPGHPEVPLPPKVAEAVKEYRKLTAGLERVASEVFVVNDELKVGGTFDSGYISPEYPGFVLVGDTKSGKSVHQAEFEIQLACYSRGEVYLGPPVDDADQRLTFEEFFGLPMNQEVGYLVHVPVEGKPKPRIIKLDLIRGWDLAQQAAATRDARLRMDKVGLGEKVDHLGLAHEAKQAALDDLLDRTNENHWNYIGADEFRERAQELYRRFSHIWDETDTLLVKGRLS